jgi:hypothetical protein
VYLSYLKWVFAADCFVEAFGNDGRKCDSLTFANLSWRRGISKPEAHLSLPRYLFTVENVEVDIDIVLKY